ncbi:MAG: hypothetical protein Q8M58_07830 [Anaerolineales bacterium]|nr:hypothetical protein [Anaerolineales bacterium]
MDILSALAFIPGNEPARPEPLARYLPPVPEGIAQAFLAEHATLPVLTAGPGSETKRGTWVLDPFGASPRLAVEMARAGYRVLVAVSNPVTRFQLDLAAAPPSKADLQAALADLAVSRKGEERLETHLQSLYLTECSKCQRSLPAEAFIWERGSQVPLARILRCPQCGESGERQTTPADRQHAAQFAATATLHRSRALERVAPREDPDRVHAEEALECYLPRAVYALVTIINKLDGLSLTPERRRCMFALTLTACDEGNTLWPHPAERPRPKQLTIPPRFRENNIWLALERGVETWAGESPPVPMTVWPVHPPESGGICLFEGPLRELAPRLKEIPIQFVLTALPRPNQAFWTLSALWAGWLWGREAVGPFKRVLRRRRYDWNWHTAALYATLKNLAPHIALTTPFFALVAEPEPSFLSAVMLATASAGFDLQGIALRTRHDPVQILWQRRAFSLRPDEKFDPSIVGQVMDTYMKKRGEPVSYLHLHAAGLSALAKDRALAWREEALTQIHAPIQQALTSQAYVRHDGSQHSLEVGLWGLHEYSRENDPLPDRAEKAAVQFLQEHPECTQRELEVSLYTHLPGLFTPSLGIIRDILTSYATESNGRWHLRPEDSAPIRHADLKAAGHALESLATRLKFTTLRPAGRPSEGTHRLLLWQEKGKPAYAFYLLASAAAGQILRENPYPPERSLLVIPGGRAGLLACKLRRDPSLEQIWRGGWRVLKFRHLRRLAETSGLTRERWARELSADPIEPPEQMKLF